MRQKQNDVSQGHRGGIRAALHERQELARILVIAALMALGINILASWLFALMSAHRFLAMAVGLIVVLAALAYMVALFLRIRASSFLFEGVVFFDPESKSVVGVPGYKFAHDLQQTLAATFLENAALKLAWDTDPLDTERTIGTRTPAHEPAHPLPEVSYFSIVKMNVEASRHQTKASLLLHEALEFCLLEKLSTHLSGHFTVYPEGDKLITEYTRGDIPDLLLQNRILALLTTPLEDRAIFAKAKLPKTDGKLYSLHGSDGSVYSRFDLVLPRGTTVSRPAPGHLRLQNRRLVLDLSCSYDGTWTVPPVGFAELFLSRRRDDVIPLKVEFQMHANVTLRGLFRVGGWQYFEWVDTFAHNLEEFVSFDAFLTRIGWSTAFTAFALSRHARQAPKASTTQAGRQSET